jgi:hypothetical protein
MSSTQAGISSDGASPPLGEASTRFERVTFAFGGHRSSGGLRGRQRDLQLEKN